MNSKLATAIVIVDHGMLRIKKNINLTSQAQLAYQVQFVFENNSEWSTMTNKTAIFQRGSLSYAVILDSDDCAAFPVEILNITGHGQFYVDVGLLGINSTIRLPSNKVRFNVEQSTQISGVQPVVTETIYQQLVNLINSKPHYTQEQIKAIIEDYVDSEGIATETYVDTHANDTIKHITVNERSAWNDKYDKPSTGIPKTDLSSDVQTSLGKADTALQQHQDISGKQDVISDLSTIRLKATNAIPSSQKGSSGGVAELDSSGKVPSSQLPSYVDDVLEYANKSSFPAIGETGKIYIDANTNITYRWSGSVYTAIASDLALGETSSAAYRGDRGKIAYNHSQVTSGNPHNVSKLDIGLGNVDNTSDATKKTNFTGSIATNNTGFVTGGDVKTALDTKSTVSVSSTGTATDEVQYITVNGVEKKLAGGDIPDILDLLGETGVVESLADSDGALFIDNSNKIFIL